jgi:hypothetical protein
MLQVTTIGPRSEAMAPRKAPGHGLIAAGNRGFEQLTGSGGVPELRIIGELQFGQCSRGAGLVEFRRLHGAGKACR